MRTAERYQPSNETGTRSRVRILAVAPFHSPHVLCLYDALRSEEGVDFLGAILSRLPRKRRVIGWSEPWSDSYIRPTRSIRAAVRYLHFLFTADVVIFPGLFNLKSMPIHFFLRQLSGKPILMFSEGFLGLKRYSKWNLALKRFLLRWYDRPEHHLLCIGTHAAVDYRAMGLRRVRFWKFGYALPASERRPSPLRVEGTVKLLFLGQLIPRKRPELILAALGAERFRSLNWSLDIVGDGPLKSELSAIIRDRGFGDRVRIRGHLLYEDRFDAIESAHVVILPSRFDGWGVTVHEALQSGRPVVCSDGVGSSLLVEEGRSGFVFPEGSVESLADILYDLISRPQRLAEMSRRIVARGFKEYEARGMSRRLLALARSIGSGDPAPIYEDGPLSPGATSP